MMGLVVMKKPMDIILETDETRVTRLLLIFF